MLVTRTVLHLHPRTQNHIFISVSEVLRFTTAADISQRTLNLFFLYIFLNMHLRIILVSDHLDAQLIL